MTTNNNPVPTFLDPLKSETVQSVSPGASRVQNKIWGGRGGGSTVASDTYAKLTRDQWATYLNTFVPYENALIEYATSPDTVTNAVTQARANVGSAFDAQQGATQRRLSGLGLTLDPAEQHAADRSSGLARSLADVQAANMTRDATMQRQASLLGNPSPRLAGLNG